MTRIGGRVAGIVAMVVLAGCASGGAPVSSPSIARPNTPAPTTHTASPATPAPRASSAPVGVLYDPTADARAEVLAAIKAAKADGKQVFLDYGADWCPDCHTFAAALHGPEGTAMIEDHFHLVAIDVGFFDHNLDVAADYGNAILNGIPAVVVLDGTGKVVGSSADGSLANARAMTERQILDYLARWVR